jgi:L-ascorbate metabolism protein UlaG (beta-lactamase superfamily)
MEIRWFGQSFFEITTNTDIKKSVKVYIDPYDASIGLNPPTGLAADMVMVSHQHPDHNNVKLFSDPGILIDTTGEYSVAGVDIKGMLTYHDTKSGAELGVNIIYLLESEGIRIAHLGDLGHLLSDSQIREIDGVDILMIPVGGKYSINGKDAVKTIKQIEPKIVIPMHYKIPGIKVELADLDSFCKEMGICISEPAQKLSVKKASLEGKEMEVVVLEANI